MDATLERAAFSPAVPEEADAVCALIAERIAWMDRMGLHGWNEQGYLQIYDRAYFACHAAAGRLYVLRLPLRSAGPGAWSCWNRTSGGQAFPPLPHFTCMT